MTFFGSQLFYNVSASMRQLLVQLAFLLSLKHDLSVISINNWQDLFMKSALDSVFKVVLGVDLDTMCGSYDEGTKFSNAFDEASVATMYRYFNFCWRLNRFLNIGSEAVLKNSIKVIDEFVYKLIRSKIERVQNAQDDSPVSTCMTINYFNQFC